MLLFNNVWCEIGKKNEYYCGGSAWHKKSFSKTPFLQWLAPAPYVGISVWFCLCKISSRSSLHHMLALNFVPWRISIFQAVHLHKDHFPKIFCALRFPEHQITCSKSNSSKKYEKTIFSCSISQRAVKMCHIIYGFFNFLIVLQKH